MTVTVANFADLAAYFSTTTTGNTTVSAPTSGVALTVNGFAGSDITDFVLSQNATSQVSISNTNAGTSATSQLSATVAGGSLIMNMVNSATPTANIYPTAGNIGIGTVSGTVTLSTNSSGRLGISTTGAVNINAPTSGTALTVNGVSGGGVTLSVTGAGASDNIASFTTSANTGPCRFTLQNSNAGAGAYTILDLGNNLASSVGEIGVNSSNNTAYGGASSFNFLAAYGAMTFYTGTSGSPTQRILIGSNGTVTINSPASGNALTVTGNITTGYSGVFAAPTNTATGGSNILVQSTGTLTTGSVTQISFYVNTSALVGQISSSTTTTTYATSSDYRLKENIIPLSNSLVRLSQLKPSRFNFKIDPNVILDGFLAHEVQEIVPEAVVGEKDGKEMQALDPAKLVPLLTAAIQEQQKMIETLQTQVAALIAKMSM